MADTEISWGTVDLGAHDYVAAGDVLTMAFDLGDLRLTVSFTVKIDGDQLRPKPIKYRWSALTPEAAERIIPHLGLWGP